VRGRRDVRGGHLTDPGHRLQDHVELSGEPVELLVSDGEPGQPRQMRDLLPGNGGHECPSSIRTVSRQSIGPPGASESEYQQAGGRYRPSQATNASAGMGRAKNQPWPTSQPYDSSSRRVSSSSTPS